MEFEDFIKAYEGTIEAPIQKKIKSFRYLLSKNGDDSEPVLAWMKTNDGVWHRFYLDAWVPYWESLNKEEAKEYATIGCCKNISEFINEELEEYVDEDGNHWAAINMLRLYGLQDKIISNVQVKYGREENYMFAQLIIELQEGDEIIINDYGDHKNAELIINKEKVKI